MIKFRFICKIDPKFVLAILFLMVFSILIISATDPASVSGDCNSLFTPKTISQLVHFILGWLVFVVMVSIDYNKIKDIVFIVYILIVLSLIGVFFVPSIQNVHRWYRIFGIGIQPSEFAKLGIIVAISVFLDRTQSQGRSLKRGIKACFIAGIPFLLILRQPDLGTALVICPIALSIMYISAINYFLLRVATIIGSIAGLCILLIFSGLISQKAMRPYILKAIKEYQYERLNPDNHHQRSAAIAIGTGGIKGKGWKSSEFTGRGWLPYAYTDSVFAAIGEEFGLIGLIIMLLLFYYLIHSGCKIALLAKDEFGRGLAVGISVYIASHVVVNIGMMSGLLPITGVPLILISYGGSSVLVSMAAFGLLQNIYSRRFTFTNFNDNNLHDQLWQLIEE